MECLTIVEISGRQNLCVNTVLLGTLQSVGIFIIADDYFDGSILNGTVLKRLCDKGIFRNEKGTVVAVLSREEFYARQSERFVEEAFQGSLPAFLAAFTYRKAMRPEEIAQIRAMIDQYEEG